MDKNAIQYEAYCKTCGKLVYGPIPNGRMVEAAAQLHARDNPDHRIIVGFEIYSESTIYIYASDIYDGGCRSPFYATKRQLEYAMRAAGLDDVLLKSRDPQYSGIVLKNQDNVIVAVEATEGNRRKFNTIEDPHKLEEAL